MKTYVIRVESYDDVISVGDKMAWAQAQRIVLILPLKRSPRFTRLDWVRLQHRAQSLGALLAVVNRNPETAQLCREVGIPVFRTVEAAQKGRWRRRGTPFPLSHAWLSARLQSVQRQREEARALLFAITPKPLSLGWRVGVFLLGVGAVLVLMALLLPSAILEIELPKREQQVEMYVRLSPQTRVVQMSGVVPCKEVDAEVDSQVEEVASGVAQWPVTYARVTLIAQNLTDVSQFIPKGSPFVAMGTQPVRFEALEEVVLPAGIGQSVSIPVQAIQAGSEGNVPAGATWEAEGSLGLVVRLSNPAPALGGTESTVTVVSEMDLQRAREQVLVVQSHEASRIMEEGLMADEILVASTVHLQEILEEHVFPNVGQPANLFQVRVKARYRGCVVRQNDLEYLTRAMLKMQIPGEYRALGDEVRVERLDEERAVTKTDSIGLRLRGSWWLIPSLRTDEIAHLLAGKPVEETEEILNPLIKGGKVTRIALTPAWWGRFPFLPWRIQIVLR